MARPSHSEETSQLERRASEQRGLRRATLVGSVRWGVPFDSDGKRRHFHRVPNEVKRERIVTLGSSESIELVLDTTIRFKAPHMTGCV